MQALPSKHIEPYIPLLEALWDVKKARTIADFAIYLHSTVREVRRDLQQLARWQFVTANPVGSLPLYRLSTEAEHRHCACGCAITIENAVMDRTNENSYLRYICSACYNAKSVKQHQARELKDPGYGARALQRFHLRKKIHAYSQIQKEVNDSWKA